MSRRPIDTKQRKKVARAFRRTALPARFDLVKYLVDYKHASTKKEARQMILDGKVTRDGEPVGLTEKHYVVFDSNGTPSARSQTVVAQLVPYSFRDELEIAGD